MKISKGRLREIVKEVIKEESDYQMFFKKALEKSGKSLGDMTDQEKKDFFNKIDKSWKGKGEKNEGNAFGAAVTKAKEQGKDSFEVGGKTYKVKESVVNERTVNADDIEWDINPRGEHIPMVKGKKLDVKKDTVKLNGKPLKIQSIWSNGDITLKDKNRKFYSIKNSATESVVNESRSFRFMSDTDLKSTLDHLKTSPIYKKDAVAKLIKQIEIEIKNRGIKESVNEASDESVVNEGKFKKGDMVRVIDKPKHVTDAKKYAGKSGYVKDTIGKNVLLVQFPTIKNVMLVHVKDLEMNPNESVVNEGFSSGELQMVRRQVSNYAKKYVRGDFDQAINFMRGILDDIERERKDKKNK